MAVVSITTILVIAVGIAAEYTMTITRSVQRANTMEQAIAVGDATIETLFTNWRAICRVTPTTPVEGFTDVAKDYAAWQGDMVKYAIKPVFYAMNVTEPPQYASIGQPVRDAILDVKLGRKPLSFFQDAVKTWQSAGGNALRDFYQGVRDKYGTGQ